MSSNSYPPPLNTPLSASTNDPNIKSPCLQEPHLQISHHHPAHQALVQDSGYPHDAPQLHHDVHNGHRTAGHHQQYENSDDGLSTVAAAHHGLQALQYATAAAAAISSTAGVPGSMPPQNPVTHSYLALASPRLPDGQHQQHIGHNGHGLAASPTATSPTAASNAARQTRLRRACDMCSARKVKCDESGPPCRPCSGLNVECTFSRTMKRRGPPNRHAEAARVAKQPRLDHNVSASPHNAAETLVSISTNDLASRPLDAESIAPWDILVLLVDDFFTYIHPLMPFPHEPTFRQRFANREDRTDPQFLALLAGMMGALVASFPRSARAHLKSLGGPVLFPRAITMIEKCRYVAAEARGAMFLTKPQVTSDDAATSYFLGLAAGYTFHWKMCRRYMQESLTFIQELGYHRQCDRPDAVSLPERSVGHPEVRPFSHIEDQIGKRLFYVMLLGTRSLMQLGTSAYVMLIPPPSGTQRYPDKPAEVDDKYIFHDHIMQQPPETLPLMAGFNKAIDVYMATNTLAGIEMTCGMTSLDWPEQKMLLTRCLREVKDTVAHLPPDLHLNRDAVIKANSGSHVPTTAGTSARVPSAEFFDDLPGIHYYPPGSFEPQANDLRFVLGSQPERRQRVQYNIQQANIYLSELATRSFCVEFYMNLRDAAGGIKQREGATVKMEGAAKQTPDENINPELVKATYSAGNGNGAATDGDSQADEDAAIALERELIVKHLLAVLASIPQRHMEPNGASLHNKIRQVASTLLNDAPERKGPLAMRAEEYLHRFMEILERLERTAGGGPAPGYGDGTSGANGGQSTGNGWGQGQGEGGVAVDGGMTAEDEEQELRDWADLRDHQVRFLQNGGFLGT